MPHDPVRDMEDAACPYCGRFYFLSDSELLGMSHVRLSLSAAMIVATESQRQKMKLHRKGVANGWDFWQWEGK